MKLLKYIKEHKEIVFFIIALVFLCLFKQFLVSKMPLYALAGAVEDDGLMVKNAKSILDGNWLGEYKYNTLLKNQMFPLFLRIIYGLNISYLSAVTILYSIASLFLIYNISGKIKNKFILIIIFGFVLFNPITYSRMVVQRVYRNSLIPGLSLMVVSGYIGLLLKQDKKILEYALISLITSISFGMFYYTREDSIWLMPFSLFMMFSILIMLFINYRKNKNLKDFLIKGILVILPFIVMNIFGMFFANMNYKCYGVRLANIQTEGAMAEAFRTMNSVKPNVNVPKVTNPKEKIQRMADVSPSLAKIELELNKEIEKFANPTTGEVEDGLFGWALLNATEASGFKTLPEQMEIFRGIKEELNSAMNQGLLERQALMPVINDVPLSKGDFKNLIIYSFKAMLFIMDYRNVEKVDIITSPYDSDYHDNMQNLLVLTRNNVLLDMSEDSMRDYNDFIINNQEQYVSSLRLELRILSLIKVLYTLAAYIIQLLGMFSFILIIGFTIKDILNKKYELLKISICIIGILGAILTLVLGVVYTHITKVEAINYLYLCGAFPLSIVLSCISIVTIIEYYLNKRNEK